MDYFDVLFAKTNGVSENTCYNEIEAMLKTTVGHSSKNLMPITLESGTYNQGGANLTYTVDKITGTITFNGNTKPTGSGAGYIFFSIPDSVSGDLYLSGGYSDKLYIRARDNTAGGYCKKWDGNDTSGSKGETDSEQVKLVSGHTNVLRILFAEDQTFTNAVLKPMLRSGSISDNTFEPYVTPTDEKKQDKPVELDSTVLSWNIAEIQSKYETLKFVVEYTMDEISTIEYNVVEVPTFIFGRGDTSYYKIFTFSAEYARDNFDAISFTENDGNVTVNLYTASSQNIIKIIGSPK